MDTDYKPVDISEKELEDLIRKNPGYIEEGLIYIDHQTSTTRGPLDVVLKDSGNALVIAELKIVEDDGMLTQGIDYYDYIQMNLEGYSRAFNKFDIDPNQELRLLLIAPSFSVSLLNRIKWINIPVSLFYYQCIKLIETGKILPIFKEIIAPTLPERIDVYSLEDRYKYITNIELRKLAKESISTIQEWNNGNILIEPTKYDISIKCNGRVFAYLVPRRQHFLFYTNDSDGKWTGYKIDSQSDLDIALPFVRVNFEKINQ